MTDEGTTAQRRSQIADRVTRGEFDGALRPMTPEEALKQGPRQFFALAAEVTRGEFDPSEQWDEFVRALWEQVDAGFGLTPDDEEHAGVPRAWFDHADDRDVVVWDRGSREEPR